MDYNEEIKIQHTRRLREMLLTLPNFLPEFFKGVADKTSYRTRTSYALDFKTFFEYIADIKKDKPITSLSFDDFKSITVEDIEDFMEYITYYEKERGDVIVKLRNEERGKARKLSSIRTLFAYFYKKRKISSNPAELVDLPKQHDKAIVKLEVDEVSKLLDEIELGKGLTGRQALFHEKNKLRDLAIVTLLLGTGLRISECVGVNVTDINFDIGGIKIKRKGGDESIIYFGEEVRDALENYLAEREALYGNNDDALFLSSHKRRITVRAVQNLVKKYSKLVTMKNISPHKLRSTYGTNLYRETGDIYLVADVLGHKDINTTRKYYASMDEERRRMAAKIVKLRSE